MGDDSGLRSWNEDRDWAGECLSDPYAGYVKALGAKSQSCDCTVLQVGKQVTSVPVPPQSVHLDLLIACHLINLLCYLGTYRFD